MEDVFNKLQRERKNSVDNLIKWMQDSKLVTGEKAAEENMRKLFEGIQDTTNVELEKFKEAIGRLAEQQKAPAEQFLNTLAKEGSKLLEAVTSASAAASKAAITTFTEVMNKK